MHGQGIYLLSIMKSRNSETEPSLELIILKRKGSKTPFRAASVPKPFQGYPLNLFEVRLPFNFILFGTDFWKVKSKLACRTNDA